jgi:outer membrane receptor for ferrienterochelin and colicin
MTIAEKCLYYKSVIGDIHEHMDTLSAYAFQSDTIVEIGTRYLVSTWAFLFGMPDKMTCIDIAHPNEYGDIGKNNLEEAINVCSLLNIDFKFIQGNDLEIEIPVADLIFIDTDHTYEQLSKELKKFGNNAKKFLIFHDTNEEEMTKAIYEFLEANMYSWRILEKKDNCNGLMVLGRL